ncbi:MBL fold metallo-hydrolase [bacterium]|nr:MAG: MBL fold metallo-hydrolase [bacterium]
MQLIIHRGTHQIGGTCVELRSGKTRIILDYGMPLAASDGKEFDDRFLQDRSAAELIKERVLFDIPGLYKGQEPQVNGILISHSHKDHYGLLSYLHPDICVYVSEGVLKLIHVLNVFTHKRSHVVISKPCIVKHKVSFDIGDFRVTPYLVDHSGFDAMSFLIEEKPTGKRLFYSGDFRASGWKRALVDRFIKNPPKNIDCLLMEGTMIERQGGAYQDEQAVLDGVEGVLKKAEKNVILAYCSGQNIDRIVTFYKAARRAKATLVIDPYIATVLHVLKNERNKIPQLDWDSVRVLIGNYRGRGDVYINKIVNSDFKYLTFGIGKHKIKAWDIGKEKALVVMRDSMIPLIRKVPDVKGATLIYSQWDGYIRDKKKASIFWDFMRENDLKLEHIHTSGHATVDILKQLARALKPKRIIPIHTEHPERFKEYFGKSVAIAEDGQLIEI